MGARCRARAGSGRSYPFTQHKEIPIPNSIGQEATSASAGPVADYRGFFNALSITLPPYGSFDVTIPCFADPGSHGNDDARPSCSLSLDSGLWCCHGCGARGNAYQAALATGCTPVEADRLLVDYNVPRCWGTVEAIYDYLDEAGLLRYQVIRDRDKQFRQRQPDPATGAWTWNMRDVDRLPYRLPELLEAVAAGQTIHVVEGEKDVESIRAAGGAATCNSGGASKWQPAFASYFEGASVVIVADNDAAGLKHAQQVLGSLGEVALEARIVVARSGKDAFDHLASGHGLGEFELPPSPEGSLADLDAEAVLTVETTESSSVAGKKKSIATRLIELVEEAGMELFHDSDKTAYASYVRDGHWETHSLKSSSFKNRLRLLFWEKEGRSANSNSLGDAIATLEGKALFEGSTKPVSLRLGAHEGLIYIDLGDENWTAVEISPTGWRVTTEPAVRFRRRPGMSALPEPARGGSLKELRPLLNLAGEDDWRLVIAWLLSALRPPGQPYPLLALSGEQGSAKSTTAHLLRELVDPNTAALRAAPRDVRDLMIAANAGWVICLDNLSFVRQDLSDALCRLATGGGFSTRELYTDDEERIFDAQRPVILNGIEELATRSDLLDRALLLSLPTIDMTARRDEKEFWMSFRDAQPRILGALLDGVSAALANLPSTTLAEKPRMADFALWVTAAEPGLGWEPGSFMRSYVGNREQADLLALEASLIGQPLFNIAAGGFAGNATELLELLNDQTDEKIRRSNAWPKNPKSLSGHVKRLAPNLRALGVEVDFERISGKRLILLRSQATVTSVTTDPDVRDDDVDDGDDGDTQPYHGDLAGSPF